MEHKTYKAVYNKPDEQGVYSIALVNDPAMEDIWVALSVQKAELQFHAVDEKRHLLLGAILIPNKKIYRNVGGNEFYVTFEQQTINDLAHDFIRRGFQNNSNEEHEIELSGVSFVESWIVEDSEKDKSSIYGKSYEEGTWVAMAKVSPELYEKATNGTFNGFSIDGLLGLEELKFNNQINNSEIMTAEQIKEAVLDGFKAIFSSKEEEIVKEEEAKAVIEAAEEEIEETVEEETPDSDVEMLKAAIGDLLAQFKKDIDERIEAIEAKFSTDEDEKEAKIEELEAELEKTPEVEAVKPTPAKQAQPVQQAKGKSIRDRVRQNLAQLN